MKITDNAKKNNKVIKSETKQIDEEANGRQTLEKLFGESSVQDTEMIGSGIMNLGENEKKDSNVEKRNNVQILRTVEILVGKISALTKATVKMGRRFLNLKKRLHC